MGNPPVFGRTLFSLVSFSFPFPFFFSLDGKGTKDQALIKKLLGKGPPPLKRASPPFIRPALTSSVSARFFTRLPPLFPERAFL